MLRAAALSLLILVSVVATLPLVDSSAHHTNRPGVSRRSRLGRRHSRAWWRRHRARLRRRLAEQRRTQALRNRERGRSLNNAAESHKKSPAVAKLSTVSTSKNSMAVPAAAASAGWSRRAHANGQTSYVLNGQNGQFLGEATLSVVGSARVYGELMMTGKQQRKTLAGVPHSELRRTVIDKMIAAGGWVVNDFQREIGGRQVFVVVAQTPASADGRTPQQSWVFFFAEAEGRVYSLATNSPSEFSDRVADGAAQLITSLLAGSRANPAEASLR